MTETQKLVQEGRLVRFVKSFPEHINEETAMAYFNVVRTEAASPEYRLSSSEVDELDGMNLAPYNLNENDTAIYLTKLISAWGHRHYASQEKSIEDFRHHMHGARFCFDKSGRAALRSSWNNVALECFKQSLSIHKWAHAQEDIKMTKMRIKFLQNNLSHS